MSLAGALAALPPDARREALSALDPAAAELLTFSWSLWRRADQTPPDGDWQTWLLLSGRGAGKTRSGAEWTREQAETGRRRSIALVAPTHQAGRKILIEGPSGLLSIAPPWCRPVYEAASSRITWPNGAVAHLLTSEAPDRLRGFNLDGAWCDELTSWENPDETWLQMRMALRLTGPLGDPPQIVVTTTPKPVKLLTEIMGDPSTVITRASTFDNKANLSPAALAALRSKYENTRIGRQELLGEMLTESDAALWTRDTLDRTRVSRAPDLVRVVVGLDPSGTRRGDIAGIVVAGVSDAGHIFVIGDYSLQASPDTWARKAAAAYHAHQADCVVAETNYGAEMVTQTLRHADPGVPVRTVTASRGKAVRAEPVAMLFEQAKAHITGTLPALEDELVTWEPSGAGPSPGRLDAMVWAISTLCEQRAETARFVRWNWMER